MTLSLVNLHMNARVSLCKTLFCLKETRTKRDRCLFLSSPACHPKITPVCFLLITGMNENSLWPPGCNHQSYRTQISRIILGLASHGIVFPRTQPSSTAAWTKSKKGAYQRQGTLEGACTSPGYEIHFRWFSRYSTAEVQVLWTFQGVLEPWRMSRKQLENRNFPTTHAQPEQDMSFQNLTSPPPLLAPHHKVWRSGAKQVLMKNPSRWFPSDSKTQTWPNFCFCFFCGPLCAGKKQHVHDFSWRKFSLLWFVESCRPHQKFETCSTSVQKFLNKVTIPLFPFFVWEGGAWVREVWQMGRFRFGLPNYCIRILLLIERGKVAVFIGLFRKLITVCPCTLRLADGVAGGANTNTAIRTTSFLCNIFLNKNIYGKHTHLRQFRKNHAPATCTATPHVTGVAGLTHPREFWGAMPAWTLI